MGINWKNKAIMAQNIFLKVISTSIDQEIHMF